MECLHNCLAGGGVLLGILSEGVPRGSLNHDPISDHPFSDLSPKKFMSSLTLTLAQKHKIHI